MTERVRREWLASLAMLVSPTFPAQAVDGLIPFLGFLEDIPDTAFTRDTLMEVVSAPRRLSIPSLDEIRKPLLAWVKDNRPASVRFAIAAPEAPARRGPPSEMEIAAVAAAMSQMASDTADRHAAMPQADKDATRPTARYLSDGQLLAAHEKLAAEGNPVSAERVKFLKARMAKERMEQAA
jgi:hypothetical protein